MNFRQVSILLGATALVGFALPSTVHGADQTEEYNQVRKIALRDPKVQAAFRKANEELDKRIIAIDPSLKPFIVKQRGKGEKAAVSKTTVARTHVVAKGETLTSIARRYRLSVNSLAKANHISKQSTLQVGQKLIIPGKG